MERVMIRLLNMSFAAGCTVLIVLVLRLFLKKLPKGYSYGLWMIVLFRFLCPAVIPSPFSLFPVNPEPVGQKIVYEAEPEIKTGIVWVDRAVNSTVGESLAVKDPAASANPVQIWLALGFVLWLFGFFLFVSYHLWQLTVLKKKVANAVLSEKRAGRIQVRESDRISGAFVLGVLRPVIYLPVDLKGDARAFILDHEQVHIDRKDYLIKLLGLGAVAVHWFNPLAWVGFRMMCADMEMSCDEQVLNNMKGYGRKAYSQVLLEQAEKSSRLLPLAFGRNHTYLRVRNILTYHKPGVVLTAVTLGGLAIIGVGLITSPRDEVQIMNEKEAMAVSIIGGADGPTSIFVAGKIREDEAELTWQRERPESAWLALIQLEGAAGRTGGRESAGSPSPLYIDFASDTALIFHGDFGLFSFTKGKEGKWNQQIFVKDVDTADKLTKALKELLPQENEMSGESIRLEDSFRLTDISGEERENRSGDNFRIIDYDAVKMSDGRIGILGTAASSGDNPGRLIDLYYGYYDPGEQIMKQIFLFLGDGEEIVNPEGKISEGHWLFERDKYDYYLRTPRKLLETEATGGRKDNFLYDIPYGRMEIARSRSDTDQLIDDLVFLDGAGRERVVLTEERMVYRGFEEATTLSFKRPLPVSIRFDGSGRRVTKPLYSVSKNMCYADGYLYYEGWTNDSEFPVPLMGIKPDFTGEEKIGELAGSLICVREGGACLWMDWERKRIMVSSVDNLKDSEAYWEYLKNGEKGRQEVCTMKNMGNGYLRILLEAVGEPFYQEEYWLWMPFDMWEEDFGE